MSTYPRTTEFFDNVVKPSVDEYLARPEDIRRGRLAAIVLNHMVDYWCVDTASGDTRKEREAALEDARAALRADTPIPSHPGYSAADIIRDLADASKHAELTRKNPQPQLTHAGQVKRHYIGALGTAPLGMVPGGMLKPVDVRVTLDDGKSFILSYVIRKVTDAWRNKLGIPGTQA
ncbi:hypothetical protein [Acidiferrobacter thiooxydans]|uniref:Uncharacterized protein n=1 Tax=Acidiferrobacter thiooxydans TaxID=163359 RepID=A0A368HLE5_9GAMM|nr:hypothetical protein [Acidiferrobacter thiooxydans]RCN59110.1 hypothetical protein C4900_05120 [Acidiferrobacter thiooxydans]